MSRLIAAIALATRTAPSMWAAELDGDPRMVSTVLDLMAEQQQP